MGKFLAGACGGGGAFANHIPCAKAKRWGVRDNKNNPTNFANDLPDFPIARIQQVC
jgi:hypothetical protein